MSKLKNFIKEVEEMPTNELVDLLNKYDIKLIPKDKKNYNEWLENKLKEIKDDFKELEKQIKNNKE